MLESMAIEFYTNLCKDDAPNIQYIIQGHFTSLSNDDINVLSKEVTNQEIHAALFGYG